MDSVELPSVVIYASPTRQRLGETLPKSDLDPSSFRGPSKYSAGAVFSGWKVVIDT